MNTSSTSARRSASDQYWRGVVFLVWIRALDSIWNFWNKTSFSEEADWGRDRQGFTWFAKGLLFCLFNGNISCSNCLKYIFLSLLFVKSSIIIVPILFSLFSPSQCKRASLPTAPPKSLPPRPLMTLFLVPWTHPSSLNSFWLNCVLIPKFFSSFGFCQTLLVFLFPYLLHSFFFPGSFLSCLYFSTFCLRPFNFWFCTVLILPTLPYNAHEFTNLLCAEGF